jgi:RecA/RadA recombinase
MEVDRLKRNAAFIQYLHATSRQRQKQLLKSASAEEYKTLCECCSNILDRNVPLTDEQVAVLRQPQTRKIVYTLADKRIPLARKRTVVVNQLGGFIPLLPILAAIPSLISLFT